jgi:hypothetical protein
MIKLIEWLYRREKWAQCQNVLKVILPWIKHLELSGNFCLDQNIEVNEKKRVDQEITYTVLHNVFYLTFVFSDRYSFEIEELWKSLIETEKVESSIVCIVDFLVLMVLTYPNRQIIHCMKTVSVMFSHTSRCQTYFETVLEKIGPNSLDIPSSALLEEVRSKKCKPSSKLYLADAKDFGMASSSKSRVSPGFLLCTSVVEMTIEMKPNVLLNALPVLLTVVFVHLDASVLKTEEMRLLLVNLIQVMLKEDPSKKDRVDATIAALNLKEGKRVWRFEHHSLGQFGLESEDQLGALALELLDLFENIYPNLGRDWGLAALQFGCTCRDYHLSSRALQIYRKLTLEFHSSHLHLLLKGFSYCIADPDDHNQKLSNEFVICIKRISHNLTASQLVNDYPQLFWTSIALLSSTLEWEYMEGLKMTATVLKNLDLTDNKIIHHILSTLPTKWPAGFQGILRLLLRGLRSSETESLSLEIMNSLLFVSVPIFFDSRASKFLFVSLANAPRLLQVYTESPENLVEEGLRTADLLALAGSSSNCDSLARLFTAYANQRISKQDDFLKQLVHIIKEEYSSFQWEVIRFCLGLLANPTPCYPHFALLLLEQLLRDLPKWSEELAAEMDFSESWLLPLVALLDTPLYINAARVLDSILSGRLKATEAEITTAVGGSHNMYGFVKRSKQLKMPVHSSTGWSMDSSDREESDHCKKRIASIAKTCEHSQFRPIFTKKKVAPVHSVPRDTIDHDALISQFKELEIYFRNAMQQ